MYGKRKNPLDQPKVADKLPQPGMPAAPQAQTSGKSLFARELGLNQIHIDFGFGTPHQASMPPIPLPEAEPVIYDLDAAAPTEFAPTPLPEPEAYAPPVPLPEVTPPDLDFSALAPEPISDAQLQTPTDDFNWEEPDAPALEVQEIPTIAPPEVQFETPTDDFNWEGTATAAVDLPEIQPIAPPEIQLEAPTLEPPSVDFSWDDDEETPVVEIMPAAEIPLTEIPISALPPAELPEITETKIDDAIPFKHQLTPESTPAFIDFIDPQLIDAKFGDEELSQPLENVLPLTPTPEPTVMPELVLETPEEPLVLGEPDADDAADWPELSDDEIELGDDDEDDIISFEEANEVTLEPIVMPEPVQETHQPPWPELTPLRSELPPPVFEPYQEHDPYSDLGPGFDDDDDAVHYEYTFPATSQPPLENISLEQDLAELTAETQLIPADPTESEDDWELESDELRLGGFDDDDEPPITLPLESYVEPASDSHDDMLDMLSVPLFQHETLETESAPAATQAFYDAPPPPAPTALPPLPFAQLVNQPFEDLTPEPIHDGEPEDSWIDDLTLNPAPQILPVEMSDPPFEPSDSAWEMPLNPVQTFETPAPVQLTEASDQEEFYEKARSAAFLDDLSDIYPDATNFNFGDAGDAFEEAAKVLFPETVSSVPDNLMHGDYQPAPAFLPDEPDSLTLGHSSPTATSELRLTAAEAPPETVVFPNPLPEPVMLTPLTEEEEFQVIETPEEIALEEITLEEVAVTEEISEPLSEADLAPPEMPEPVQTHKPEIPTPTLEALPLEEESEWAWKPEEAQFLTPVDDPWDQQPTKGIGFFINESDAPYTDALSNVATGNSANVWGTDPHVAPLSDDDLMPPPAIVPEPTADKKPAEEEPVVADAPSMNPEDWRVEDMAVLATYELNPERWLLLVKHQTTLALMGQVGAGDHAGISIIKIFEQNPLPLGVTAEDFSALKEGTAGTQEMFLVRVGPWRALISSDANEVKLHTELS